MELYLFFAAALLLPFGGQLALLRLGRRHQEGNAQRHHTCKSR